MHMLTTFAHWTVQYYKRSANTVADLLAGYAIPTDADTTAVMAGLPPHNDVIFQAEKTRAREYTTTFLNHYQPMQEFPSQATTQTLTPANAEAASTDGSLTSFAGLTL